MFKYPPKESPFFFWGGYFIVFFRSWGSGMGEDVKSLHIVFFLFFHGFFMVLELLYVGASYSRLYGV